jgi:hypothetical protein
LLKILGHQISISSWGEDSKRLFWAASVVLFFGSFRVSEILAKYEFSFDPLTTLTWEDIVFFKNSVRIFIKFPKIFIKGGISVDLFPVSCKDLCPVTVLKSLKKFKNIDQCYDKPIFMFKNGILLTQSKFNKTLRELLSPVLGNDALFFSSHSFRAAIPAALANHPKVASREEIMGWGRWDSKAFEKYTRLKQNKRKETFESIWEIINV